MPRLSVKLSVAVTSLAFAFFYVGGGVLYGLYVRSLPTVPLTVHALVIVLFIVFGLLGYKVVSRSLSFAFGAADQYDPLVQSISGSGTDTQKVPHGLTQKEQRRVEEFLEDIDDENIDNNNQFE